MSLQINQNIIMTKKEIEAAIKPEFMAKLKQLRVKTKFINNIMHPKWNATASIPALKACLNATTWQEFIDECFNWKNSPEGHDFWSIIQDK